MEDGIVSGQLMHRLQTCDVCGHLAACIMVDRYELRDIHYTKLIISVIHDITKPGQYTAVYLGVSCGCYAKLHRQICHVREDVIAGRSR